MLPPTESRLMVLACWIVDGREHHAVNHLQSRPHRQPSLMALRRIDSGLTSTVAVLVSNPNSDKEGIHPSEVLPQYSMLLCTITPETGSSLHVAMRGLNAMKPIPPASKKTVRQAKP